MGRGKDDELSERRLDTGWAAAARARVRAATQADVDTVVSLVEMAGAPFEPELSEALISGTLGAGLRVGLRGDHETFLHDMAQRFTAHQHTNPLAPYLDAGLLLVAEHRDHGVSGALLAYPPQTVAAQFTEHLAAAGLGKREQYKLLLGVGMFLCRIKAVAVAEAARGHNLGGSLLKRAKQIYTHCGYQVLYGAMPLDQAHLPAFYARAGFDVHPAGAPLDLSTMFGYDVKIWPGPGEQLFSRNRL